MYIKHKNIYLVLLLITTAAFLFTLYLQYFENILPCLLCWLQRIFNIGLIIIFFFAWLFSKNTISKNAFNCLALILTILGGIVALRQIWLQHQPIFNQDLSCLPNTSFLVTNFPIQEIIKISFTGTADCAVINWSFLGLSLAEWSLIFFVCIFSGVLFQFRRLKH